MNSVAVVLEKPEQLVLSRLDLPPPGDEDVVVDIDWTGISTGTERLLWSGRMPAFPGMGYPLVPGYELVGRVTAAGSASGNQRGRPRFRPGRALLRRHQGSFWGRRFACRRGRPPHRAHRRTARRARRPHRSGRDGVSRHSGRRSALDLIVGHGVLGRLLARITLALTGEPPVVWERDP